MISLAFEEEPKRSNSEGSSHDEPAKAPLNAEGPEAASVEEEALEAVPEAVELAADTPEQPPAVLKEPSSSERDRAIPLPGLSAAQTELFYDLNEAWAKSKIDFTVDKYRRLLQDERELTHLIAVTWPAPKPLGVTIKMMFKLFPGSKRLSFLFDEIKCPLTIKQKSDLQTLRTVCEGGTLDLTGVSFKTLLEEGTSSRRRERHAPASHRRKSSIRIQPAEDSSVAAPVAEIPRIGTEFITGSAGTGKTTEVQTRRAADPKGVVLAATTGIAAVNLGPEVTTIHSLLKFFDYKSLAHAYTRGTLRQNIHRLADTGIRELVIDEVSMLSAGALDVLYNAFHEVTQEDGRWPIKLTLCGDFCQLPPIADKDAPETGKYAFEAKCWPRFAENTKRLSKIWRQDDEDYIRALQSARCGTGEDVVARFRMLGVRFERALDNAFVGTTLCAANQEVDRYNWTRLFQLPGGAQATGVNSTRWACSREPLAWENIPRVFAFKPGAYVMILANDSPRFTYANGDCGTIVGVNGDRIVVQLKRSGQQVEIGKIIRTHTTQSEPYGLRRADVIRVRDERQYDDLIQENNGEPPERVVMLREPYPMWITGWVRYYPLRLAYATTVHKSQGLSLDAIQLDLRSGFLAQPAMMYVALSRCRTPGGLVLVGNPDDVVTKTQIDPRVKEWL